MKQVRSRVARTVHTWTEEQVQRLSPGCKLRHELHGVVEVTGVLQQSGGWVVTYVATEHSGSSGISFFDPNSYRPRIIELARFKKQQQPVSDRYYLFDPPDDVHSIISTLRKEERTGADGEHVLALLTYISDDGEPGLGIRFTKQKALELAIAIIQELKDE